MVKVGFLLPPRQANKSANEHAIQMYHVVCMKGSAYACELSDGSIQKKVYLTRAYSVHQPEFSLSITMKSYGDGEIWGFEVEMEGRANESKVLLGLDGGATSTVCICTSVPSIDEQLPDPPPVLARAVGGCSNHNSIGETAAREEMEQVMAETLMKAGFTRSNVQAVCLAVSGVNHVSDQHRMIQWLREIFPGDVQFFVHNDSVAALASGTGGKLHGCVLIAGTGTIACGFTEDGREARAAGAGPILGDWGSGYGIASQALTAVMRAHDGRGQPTSLTSAILHKLKLSSVDEVIGWTYADSSWAHIAALVPVVKACAVEGDEVAQKVLLNAIQELVASVRAVVQRLNLSGKDGNQSFPLVMVGGVLETDDGWDMGKKVVSCISKDFPGVIPVQPKNL